MAAVNPPFVIQDQSHSSDIFRRMVAALRLSQGVVGSGDLAVTQNGSPNMSVNVAAGLAVVDGTQDVTHQGSYVCLNDATVNLAIAAADPTNPRIDIVVAKVQDTQYSGATDAWSLAVVTGTPAPSPAPPAAPANSFIVAQVAVAALASSIVNANITDKRSFTRNFPSHIAAVGSAPTVGNLGAGITSATVVGNDTSGIITFVTGGSTVAALTALFKLTFAVPYGQQPVVVICFMDGLLYGGNGVSTSSVSASSFTVVNGDAMGASNTFHLAYFVIGVGAP